MSRTELPKWTEPFPVSKENITAGMVNLSRLSPDDKARAFKKLQEAEPGIAEFLTGMHRSFGRSELLVDADTAKRLGVKS